MNDREMKARIAKVAAQAANNLHEPVNGKIEVRYSENDSFAIVKVVEENHGVSYYEIRVIAKQ